MTGVLSRRALAALAGSALLGATSPAFAQQGRRLPLVGLVLGTAPAVGMTGPNPAIGFVRSFVHALRDLGWVDGRTVALERFSAEGMPVRAADIPGGLVSRRADVIAIGGERWLIDAARSATRDIPIVANLLLDPVAAGLVASFARPGGNLTGVTRASTGAGLDAKVLQLLLEIAPGRRRVAFLAGSASIGQFLAIERNDGVMITPFAIDNLDQLEAALQSVGQSSIDGLIVGSDGPVFFGAARIAAFAAERRIPAVYGFHEAIAAGGLMSYAAGGGTRFRLLAKLVARFLDGARIGEVPVENPTSFDLIINAKAAAALGLTVPATLAAQAEEVVE